MNRASSTLQARLLAILEPDEAKPSSAARRISLVVASLIVFAVITTIIDTVPEVRARHGDILRVVEFVSLGIFSVEYLVRLWAVGANPQFRGIRGRFRWAIRFWPLIDLIAIVPGFLVWFDVDLRVVRALRLLRLFRLGRHSRGVRLLARTFYASRQQLTVTFSGALVLLLVASSLVYYAERGAQPEAFASIPHALWWGVCTLTTVGYGDVYPVTALGRVIASIVALMGIATFAVPAGVIAANFEKAVKDEREIEGPCPRCGR